MKKLLYIGHEYHNKTASTRFLKDLFESKYDVDYFYYDPYSDSSEVFKQLKNKRYDIVVLFQIMPSINFLAKIIKFNCGVFFPMFDGVPSRGEAIWYEYRNFKIINFSRTLHQELKNLGFDSYYFQFFPEPKQFFDWGNERSVFFWQRISYINLNVLDSVIDLSQIEQIHVHKALDPGFEFQDPADCLKDKISYSEWLESKEDLYKIMEKSSLYFAPRVYEGIGMSFLEAMAMGRCVIAPNNPTMNEYIEHNKTGFLYDYNLPQKITLANIREIQKNALEYMKNGYEEWKDKKYDILNVIEKKIHHSVRISSFVSITRIVFFGIPLLKILRFSYKKKFYLFNKILLFKSSIIDNTLKFYLFGFILLLTVTKKKS